MKATTKPSPSPFRLAVFLAGWAAAASALGATGKLPSLPPPAIPALVISLTAIATLCALRVGWLTQTVDTFGLKALVVPHLIRFIGFHFLWLHSHGRMPVEFAIRAGWGDVVAAVGAAILLVWPEGTSFRRAVLLWNVFALLDLLVAVGTAVWLNLTRPGSMIEIVTLPLAALPLFLVPLMLTLHFLIFRRLMKTSPQS